MTPRLLRIASACYIAAIVLLAGCTPTTQLPSAGAAGTLNTVSATTTVSVGSAPTSLEITTGAGNDVSITIPATTSGSGSITVTGSSTVPAGFTALNASRAIVKRAQQGYYTLTPMCYVLFAPNGTDVTFSAYPSFTIPFFGTNPNNGPYYIGYGTNNANYPFSGWAPQLIGPGLVSGNMIGFAGGTVSPPYTLSPGWNYVFVIYQSVFTPTTPTPSPTPSPTPMPTPSSQPVSGLVYTFNGPSATGTFTQGVYGTAATLPFGGDVEYSLTFTFQQPASASGTLDFADALDNGDITPALAADNATVGNQPVLYFSIYNPGSSAVAFGTKLPQLQAMGDGFMAWTDCQIDSASNIGGTVSWSYVTGTIEPANLNITFPAATLSNTLTFGSQSQQIWAISCML
jgi:hypothetical protein